MKARKLMIGLASAAAVTLIAVSAMPTEVLARGGHGGHGGFHGGFRGGWGGSYYRYPAYYPYAYACYRNVRVATPIGWQWQRVYVCG
jgi:hypothetical protein